MKIIIKISFLLLLTTLFSCDEIYYVDCDECITKEPVECHVSLHFQESYGKAIIYEVTIYLGKVEDGIALDSFQVFETSGDSFFTALINNEYTVVATTTIDGKSYRVVNSTTPITRFVEGLCTDDCYVIRKNTINLRLKYY